MTVAKQLSEGLVDVKDLKHRLYRHIYYDASQELIRFNYMKQPNVMLVFNEFGDLVSVEKTPNTDKEKL